MHLKNKYTCIHIYAYLYVDELKPHKSNENRLQSTSFYRNFWIANVHFPIIYAKWKHKDQKHISIIFVNCSGSKNFRKVVIKCINQRVIIFSLKMKTQRWWWSKMTAEEDTKLTFSYGHTESTATYGSFSSEKVLKTSWSSFNINNNRTTSRQVGETEALSCPNPTPSALMYNW